MFNNLAAYLLGTNSSAATQQPRTPATTNDEPSTNNYQRHHHNTQLIQQHHQHQQQQLNSIRLNSASTAVLPVDVSDDEQDDDDWVLVDRDQGDSRDSEGNSALESSSEEEGDSDHEQSPAKISHLHSPINSSSSPTDYDITHLLLPSTTNPSPIHSSSYQHSILQPSATTYTITSISSPSSIVINNPQSSSQQLPTVVNTMEESWFLTPPPCFTSTGPVHMETSPLENLLIEHPSMSVYQNVTVAAGMLLNRARSGNSVVETTQGNISSASSTISAKPENSSTTVVLLEELSSDLDDEAAEALLFEVDEEVERAYLRAAQQQQRRRRGNGQRGYNRVAAGEVMRYQQRQDRHQLVEQRNEGQQGVRNKQAQKVQIHKACQSLKRSYLERNNKAREVNFRNQRLRRGERSQGSTRSNANNNRKCC